MKVSRDSVTNSDMACTSYCHRRAHARIRLVLVLGSMRADQRLAFFLLDLSQRYQALGYSSFEFVLRMTRKEIGSYLGTQTGNREPSVVPVSA